MVGLCEENVAKVDDLYRKFIKPTINIEYLSFLTETEKAMNDGEFNFNDVEVEKSWFQFVTKIEKILEIKETLPTPENCSLYQEYYFTIDRVVTYFALIRENWYQLKAGYPPEEYLEIVQNNNNLMFDWIEELLNLPVCSDTNY